MTEPPPPPVVKPGRMPRSSWIALAVAAVVVLIGFGVAISAWVDIGDTHISLGGWLALTAGVLFTLALWVGLMSLIFISSRRGYDDRGNGR